MSMFTRFAAFLGGALLVVAGVQAEYVDPPSRVARLSYVRGEVSFSPAGEDQWVDAVRNRPLIRGDRLWADRGARAELQAGNATFRIDEGTSLQILNLDDRTAQLEITQGTLNLRVRRIYQDQIFEVDTPTLAFVISRPGEYRIDVDPRGNHTTVAVWDGGGEAHGERANFRIREGEAIRFYDTRLQDYEAFDIPRPDDFDRFCLDRDERYDRSVSRRYVSEDLIGYSDLDEYGSWTEVTEYGNVWFPSRVAVDWAPYRDGHWIWQDPWGWTWVDHADWGFAPFHYGRWVHVRNRWGWIPGPVSVRPVYAPALVAFVGGSNFSISVSTGRPIGWFPLGPREVYVPPYRASRNYFTNVNITNTVINNTYITNVYNDYSSGRNMRAVNYHNRQVAGAITAVSSDTFVNSRPVRQQRVEVDRALAARADVTPIAAFAPNERSVIGSGRAATAKPQREVFDRAVVARTAPPAAPVPFAERQAVLQRTPGRGLSSDAMESLRTPRGGPAAQVPERVRVVGNGNAANARSADSERIERGGPQRDDAQRSDRDASAGRTGPGSRSEPPARTPTIRSDGTMTPPQRDFTRPATRTEDAGRLRPSDRTEPSRPVREEAPARSRGDERIERPEVPARRDEAPARVRRDEQPQFERREAPPVREDAPARVRRDEQPQFERREAPPVREEAPARVRRDAQPQFERRESAPVQREAPPPRIEREPAPQVREQPRFERREQPAPRQEMPREEPVRRAAPPPPPQQAPAPAPQPAPQERRRGNDDGGGDNKRGRDDGGDDGRRRRE